MTLKDRERFLRTWVGCKLDANGKRPCQNGKSCNKCRTKQAEELWKIYKK